MRDDDLCIQQNKIRKQRNFAILHNHYGHQSRDSKVHWMHHKCVPVCETHTDRQTDRHTHTDSKTDRQTRTHRKTERWTDRRTDTQTDRQAERLTDRHTDKKMDTQTHRQVINDTETEFFTPSPCWETCHCLTLTLLAKQHTAASLACQ